MKKNVQIISKISFMALLMAAATFFASCSKDDDVDPNAVTLTGENKTYTLASISNPAISGVVKFAERSDNSTMVTIDLDGTSSGSTHPAHIHMNSAAETGAIIIDLNSVAGGTGMSETIIKEKKDGTPITYEQLLELDGYVNVHLSATELSTLVAQGDIGGNEATSTFKSYALDQVNDSGITGAVKFTKRVNGTTLVTVDLDGASTSVEYPVYIYDNNIATTGPIAINLNKVNGSTGLSYTNVTQLKSGTAITYDQLAAFNGHLMVSASPADLTTYVAQGNIGSN